MKQMLEALNEAGVPHSDVILGLAAPGTPYQRGTSKAGVLAGVF